MGPCPACNARILEPWSAQNKKDKNNDYSKHNNMKPQYKIPTLAPFIPMISGGLFFPIKNKAK